MNGVILLLPQYVFMAYTSRWTTSPKQKAVAQGNECLHLYDNQYEGRAVEGHIDIQRSYYDCGPTNFMNREQHWRLRSW